MSVNLLLSSVVYKTHRNGQGLGGWKVRPSHEAQPVTGDIRVKVIGLMGWDHLRPLVTSLFSKSASTVPKWKRRGIESQLAF